MGIDGRQVMQVVQQIIRLLLGDCNRAIERLGYQFRGLDHSNFRGHDDGGGRDALCVCSMGWWDPGLDEVSNGESRPSLDGNVAVLLSCLRRERKAGA